MNRREFLASSSILAVAPGPALAAPRRKPNFIVILCDDMGYGDIGATGGRTIATPNLDRMAKKGTVFTDFYAAANLCTPSRAGLLTGRYPVRTGLGRGVILRNDSRVLPTSEVTIAGALKPAGYVTGLFGKWHLGHTGPDWLPTHHGFDRFIGIPYSHDMNPLSLFSARNGGPTHEEVVDFPRLQQRFYEEAESFIAENAGNPFFVELALSAPHLPEHPRAPFSGRSEGGAYGDVVEEIDDIVGRLLKKLQELGIDRDTLVLFTSDNGPWYEGSAGGLRQRKGGGGYDGGYRVPLIAWQPGTVPAGRRSSAITMSIDFLPTFCALASAPVPSGNELDGLDIGPLLRGSTALSPHSELVLFDDEEPVGIRTQRWKYVSADYFRGRLFATDGKYPQLYDVMNDSSESYSLADRYPEVLEEMRTRLASARSRFARFKTPTPQAATANTGSAHQD